MSGVSKVMENTNKAKTLEALLAKSQELQNTINALESKRIIKIQEIKEQTNKLLTA